MDPITLLISAIGSLAACIGYLYKKSEGRADRLQAQNDELLTYIRTDMAKMIEWYAQSQANYARFIESELPTSLPDARQDDSKSHRQLPNKGPAK